jgi:hypothetical protein
LLLAPISPVAPDGGAPVPVDQRGVTVTSIGALAVDTGPLATRRPRATRPSGCLAASRCDSETCECLVPVT